MADIMGARRRFAYGAEDWEEHDLDGAVERIRHVVDHVRAYVAKTGRHWEMRRAEVDTIDLAELLDELDRLRAQCD